MIDLNCDAGERFGNYSFGQDKELFAYVTSCNIACGFHAGDPSVMAETVDWAVAQRLQIGAHPAYPDLLGFGRRHMDVAPSDIGPLITYQIGALQAICQQRGTQVSYVKLHGALYHRAAYDPDVATVVVEAVLQLGKLFLLGPPACSLEATAKQHGLPYAREGFADRRYQANGRLLHRREPNALIHEPATATAQVLQIVQNATVTAIDQSVIPLRVDSLCIHGDHPQSLTIARSIRSAGAEQAIAFAPISFHPSSTVT